MKTQCSLLDIVLTDISNHALLLASTDTENANDVLGGFDTHQRLADRLSQLPQADFIGLVGTDGRLASTSQQWPRPPIDVSDRDYFDYLKNHDEKSLFISNAETARGQGTVVVFFSKRINRANGMFFGVAVIGVKLTYFQAIYQSIGTLPDLSFLLLHTNGTVIAHYPDVKNRVGEKMPTETNWYQLVADGEDHLDRRAISLRVPVLFQCVRCKGIRSSSMWRSQ